MRYLLLVSHATLAEGSGGALEMLLGSRTFVRSCGMRDGMSPDEFRAGFAQLIDPIEPDDEVVLLADIGGGSPIKNALVALDDKGLGEKVMVFGGLNLPMAIAALMGIEDGLSMDAIRDAVLSEGAQAIKQL